MNIIPKKYYLDDFFDDFLANSNSEKNAMKCDIYEKGGDYHIEMDVPGFDQKDISINVDNGYLTITAEKQNEEKDEEKNYIRRERSYGKYERSFYLGDLETDGIKAEFNNGMLKLTVPKKEVVDTKKKIEIE